MRRWKKNKQSMNIQRRRGAWLVLAVSIFAFHPLQAQEVFMFVAGTKASVQLTGDAAHRYEFLIRAAQGAHNGSLQIYDAALGGIADIVSGGQPMTTTYRLFSRKEGQADILQKTLTVVNEPKYINRWVEFDSLQPADGSESWVVRVSADKGGDVNSFKLRVQESPEHSQENDWEIFSYHLPVSLYGLTENDEVQFEPADKAVRNFPRLIPAGEEQSVVSVRDNFGSTFKLPVLQNPFAAAVHGFANEWAIAIGGSAERINNLVVTSKGAAPVLWKWKPVILQRPKKPDIGILQLPGTGCRNARLILSEQTKNEFHERSPKWVIESTSAEGDSILAEFSEPGAHEIFGFFPTAAMYVPKYWIQNFIVHLAALPAAAVFAAKSILSPGEGLLLSAPAAPREEEHPWRYKWFVNGEMRGDAPSLTFVNVLPGLYEIKVVVNNGSSSALCSEASAVRKIRVNAQPYGEIKAPRIVGRSAATKFFTVNAVDPDGDSIAYRWSGPGIAAGAEDSVVTIKQDKAGDYSIKLTLSDRTGTNNSDYSTLFAYHVDADPVPVFSLPEQAAPGDKIMLSALQSKDPDNDALAVHWKVSDGSELSNPEAALSFDQPGDYTVTLTVDDGEGVENSVQSCEHSIHINAPPVPVISALDHSNSSKQNFSAGKTTDADQSDLQYSWNFGDGATAEGKDVTHVFQQSGSYKITLTVDDGQKQTNSIQSAAHTLVVNKNPIAQFSIPERWAPMVPLYVNGAASYDPDGTVTGYTWLLNGKEAALDSAADLLFPDPGDYAVALKVKDNSGFEDAVGLKTAKIHINFPPVVKRHTVPEVAEPNEPVVFDSKGTYDPDGTIASVTWSFPDGTVLTGPKVTRSFKTSGVVTIRISVDDGQGFANSVQTKDFPLLVNNTPIIVTKNLIHTNSQIVNLDASQSYDIDGQALKFDWLLSDGSHRHESSFNWQAPAGGVHFITLTVDDGQGKKNSIARETIRLIVNRSPVAVVDSIIFSCSGQTILLNGSRCYDPDNDPMTTQWNFADGTTSAEMNPAHVYTKPGYYNVQLVLSDGFAEKPTVATIPVIVEGSPQAVQGFADTTVCVNSPVEFDAARSSDPNGPLGSYTWDFGDAITTFGNKVSHAFSKPGTYTVVLTVVGNGSGRCSRVSQASSTVHVVEGPSAEFSMPEAVSMNEVIHVDAAKSRPNGILLSTKWTVQSSDTAFALDGSQAQFAFTKPGVYDVKLILTIESKTNCNIAALTRSVRVNAPPVLKWNIPKAIALGDLLVMDAAASYDPDGIITDYIWTMDGKVIATTQVASMIMTTAGKHTVSLQITDNSGTSSRSVSQVMVVDVNSKPSPFFSLPDLMYEGEEAQLLPLPAADADGDVLSFIWKIDSEEYSSSTLSFKKSGKHIVTLIANDGRGLNNSIDSVSKEISVIAKPDLKALTVPKNWLVGSEVNIAEITSFRGVGFIIDSVLAAQMPIRMEGKQAVTLGWAPKGILLAKEQFDIQVWPALEFTGKPESRELIWNPSNPATVVTVPDVNRPENRNVRFEWKKGTTIIGYGKVVAVPLTKGENRFTVTALDQDMVGARPVSMEIAVLCQ